MEDAPMKKITSLMAALAVALPVYAQQPAKPAAPAQQPAKPEAPKPATVAEAPKAPKKQTPSRRSEDARQCLEKGTNTDIIKCAEEYL
jgi:hypothetical protein